jgi:hypothetical protein
MSFHSLKLRANCYFAAEKIVVMKKILILFAFVALVIFVYLVNEGLLSDVQIIDRAMPGYRVVGLEHLGPYNKIGDSFRSVQKIAEEQGVPVKMIGVYFDNPDVVEEDSLQSLAGLVVSESDSAKLSSLPNLRGLYIPPGSAVVCSFATDGVVSMILGAMKSYPKLTEYVTAANKANDIEYVYEVYGEDQTEYVMQFRSSANSGVQPAR